MPMIVPQARAEAKEKAYLRVPGEQPQVDPQFLVLAAGDLHREGRLFMPAMTAVPEAPSET